MQLLLHFRNQSFHVNERNLSDHLNQKTIYSCLIIVEIRKNHQYQSDILHYIIIQVVEALSICLVHLLVNRKREREKGKKEIGDWSEEGRGGGEWAPRRQTPADAGRRMS